MTAATTYVKTGVVRASFVNVFRPRTKKGQNGRPDTLEYSMTILVPKSDTATMDRIRAAAKAAAMAKWDGKPPAGIQMPWHDGDAPKPKGGDYGPECKNHWVINVRSTLKGEPRKPEVVDRLGVPVVDPSQFSSGDYCLVSMNAFGYSNESKGVSFGLNNIQVVAKGVALAAEVPSATSEFSALPEGFGASFGTVPPATNAPAPSGNAAPARDPWDE